MESSLKKGATEFLDASKWMKAPVVPLLSSEKPGSPIKNKGVSPSRKFSGPVEKVGNLYAKKPVQLQGLQQPISFLRTRKEEPSTSAINTSKVSTRLSQRSSNGYSNCEFNLYLKTPSVTDNKQTNTSARNSENSSIQSYGLGLKKEISTSKNKNKETPKISLSNRFVRMGSSEAFLTSPLKKRDSLPQEIDLKKKNELYKSKKVSVAKEVGLCNKKSKDSVPLTGTKNSLSPQPRPNFNNLHPSSLHEVEESPKKSSVLDRGSFSAIKPIPTKANESLKDVTITGGFKAKKETLSQKLANNKYLYSESLSLSKVNIAIKCNLLAHEEQIKPEGPKRTEKTELTKAKSPLLKLKHAATQDFSRKTKTSLSNSILIESKSKPSFEKPKDTSNYYAFSDPKILQHWREGLEDLRKAQTLYTLVGRSARMGKKAKIGPQRKGTKMTLLFDLDETLAHCCQNTTLKQLTASRLTLTSLEPRGEESYVTVHPRPYVSQVLATLRQHFEVVLFTSASQKYADVLVGQIDPEGCIFDARFHREHCLDVGGGIFIKDLTAIVDRPLSRLLLVDNCLYSGLNQLANLVPIFSFTGDKEDDQLLKLQSFLLQAVSVKGDIRKWLTQVAKFKAT